MNPSFLYHATQIECNIRNINIKFLCENKCIDEVFDLSQECAKVIFKNVYDQLVSI